MADVHKKAENGAPSTEEQQRELAESPEILEGMPKWWHVIKKIVEEAQHVPTENPRPTETNSAEIRPASGESGDLLEQRSRKGQRRSP